MRRYNPIVGMLVALACWSLPLGMSRGDEIDIAVLAVDAASESQDLRLTASLARALQIGGRIALRDSLVASEFERVTLQLESWPGRAEVYLIQGAAFARMGEGERAEAIYAMAPDHVYLCMDVVFQAESIARSGHPELANDLLHREIDFEAALSAEPNVAYLPCYLPAAGLLARGGDETLALRLIEAANRIIVEIPHYMAASGDGVIACVHLIDAAMILSRPDLADACLSFVPARPNYAAFIFSLTERSQAFDALPPLVDAIPLSRTSALPRLLVLVAAIEAVPDTPHRQTIEAAIMRELPVVETVLEESAQLDFSQGADHEMDRVEQGWQPSFLHRLAPLMRCASSDLSVAERCREIAVDLLDRAFDMSSANRPGCGHGLRQRLDLANAYRALAGMERSDRWDERIRALVADAAWCPVETFDDADATDDTWRPPLTAAELAHWLGAPAESDRLLELAVLRAAEHPDGIGLAPLGRVALVMQRLGHVEDAIELIGPLAAHDRGTVLCLMTWFAEAVVVHDVIPGLFD